jgi:hypothetical protein
MYRFLFQNRKRKGGTWEVGGLPGPIGRVDWKSCARKEPAILMAMECNKIPAAAVVPKRSRGRVLTRYNAINLYVVRAA